MVKLSRSRKNVRKSKRNSSRKSGKFMVGGDFTGEQKTYVRKTGIMSGNKVLYDLTYSKTENDNVYTLDFTTSNIGSVISKFSTPEKYSEILKKAFSVINGSNDAKNIDEIIQKLFEGGIDSVKKRRLTITIPRHIKLTLNEDTNELSSTEISDSDQFGTFLRTLGGDIN